MVSVIEDIKQVGLLRFRYMVFSVSSHFPICYLDQRNKRNQIWGKRKNKKKICRTHSRIFFSTFREFLFVSEHVKNKIKTVLIVELVCLRMVLDLDYGISIGEITLVCVLF